MNDQQYVEWQERAIEAFAAAWYRAAGFRKGQLNPRWELTDSVIRRAWWDAANRYVAGEPLIEPVLRMVPRYKQGQRLNDEWIEVR